MTAAEETGQQASRYPDFVHTGPGTLAGRYLRRFWTPVFLSAELKTARPRMVTIMNEQFTLFRTESGRAQVMANRCAHRGTRLSTGCVDGEGLRCFYHGWLYDTVGNCIEQPAEHGKLMPNIRVRSYPTREYLGLVFAYLGEGDAPEFPYLKVFDSEGCIQSQRRLIPCNFFNQLENSVDEVHINFVHAKSVYRGGLNNQVPEITGNETNYGIERRGKRGNVTRVTHILMPNVMFSKAYYELTGWTEHLAWRVPVDDNNHAGFIVDMVHVSGEAKDKYLKGYAEWEAKLATLPSPAEVSAAVLRGDMHISEVPDRPDIITIQDNVALGGQGTDVDRNADNLATSDYQVALLRRIWKRELQAVEAGQPTKNWIWPADLNVTSGMEA